MTTDDRVRAVFEAGGVDLAANAKSIRFVLRWLSALPDQDAFDRFVKIIRARREKFERSKHRRPHSMKYFAPIAKSILGTYSPRSEPEKARDGDNFSQASGPAET